MSEVVVSSNSWGSVQAKNEPHAFGSRSFKALIPPIEVSKEQGCLEVDRREQNPGESHGYLSQAKRNNSLNHKEFLRNLVVHPSFILS